MSRITTKWSGELPLTEVMLSFQEDMWAVSVLTGQGYTPEPSDLEQLIDIDSKMRLLLPDEEFHSVQSSYTNLGMTQVRVQPHYMCSPAWVLPNTLQGRSDTGSHVSLPHCLSRALMVISSKGKMWGCLQFFFCLQTKWKKNHLVLFSTSATTVVLSSNL